MAAPERPGHTGTAVAHGWRQACAVLVAHPRFQAGVLTVIIGNAVLVGAETSRGLMERHGAVLMALNWVVQGLFVAELGVRVAASRSLRAFCADGWNLFDLLVVTIAFLPAVGPFATVARLARVLRLTRLISMSAELRLIVGTMLRSIPSMGHVVLLLGLLLYVYAIAGVFLFRDHDPQHWRDLGVALLSLFQVLTLEGWPEMQAALLPAVPWAWLYFASFVVVAVFVVINLFIAVVLNNLQVVQGELAAAGREAPGGVAAALAGLRAQVEALEQALAARPGPAGGGAGVGEPVWSRAEGDGRQKGPTAERPSCGTTRGRQ